jgi:RND family efflux transporter MFP subunit
MNSTIFKLSAVATILAVGFTSCQKKDAAADMSQSAPVDVAKVVTDSVTVYKNYPGYLIAEKEVNLVSRVNGYLTSDPYAPGGFVKAGQVLFTIESAKYLDAVKQAKAQLDTAKSEYDYNARNYQAMQKAYQSDAVSQMEVLQAKSSMETSAAAIKNAEAALASAEAMLGYCTVRAPFDGHVSVSPYSVGAYLNGEASPVVLATIYHDSEMKANFSIDAAQYHKLMADDSHALNVDMTKMPIKFSDPLTHDYTADFHFFAPNVNKSTGSVEVSAYVKNPYNELKSGMFVSVDLPDQVLKNALLVKDASIGTDQLGKYVYVVNDSDKVVYTPIKVGALINDTLRVVTSGLTPQDRYVTKALLKVRDGMKINPRLTK